MKVSVIIDSYNYAEFLPEAIESVLGQSHQPCELIVVDDGSTDGSVEIAKKLLADCPWAKVVEKENGGQLSALTIGILEAKGDLVAFLDSDDVWEPDHLETARSYFTEEKELSLYFCAYKEMEGDERVCLMGYQSGWIGSSMAMTACGQSYVGSVCSTLVVKRSVVRAHLPLPENLETDWKVNADNVIVWLTSLSGGVKHNHPAPMVRYRNHDGNNTTKSNNREFRKKRRAATARLFQYWRESFSLPEGLVHELESELRRHPSCSRALKKEYRKALKKSRGQLSLSTYFLYWLKMAR